jgi:excisionase family DNA binding protein
VYTLQREGATRKEDKMTEQKTGSGGEVLMTVEQTARRLGVGRTLAWGLVKRGEIPSIRLGRLVRVPTSALEEWIRHEASAHRSERGFE